jgi:hypothetical protein
MTEPVGEKGYAGDVTPEQAAQWMASGEAVLVDLGPCRSPGSSGRA